MDQASTPLLVPSVYDHGSGYQAPGKMVSPWRCIAGRGANEEKGVGLQKTSHLVPATSLFP